MAICKKEFADRMAENGGITKKAAFQAVGLFIERKKWQKYEYRGKISSTGTQVCWISCK